MFVCCCVRQKCFLDVSNILISISGFGIRCANSIVSSERISQVDMECTIATTYSPNPPPAPPRCKYMKAQDRNSTSSPKTVLRVNFEPGKGQEVQERKKKYLTAKYGQHQMSLIRKRLRVEMWMFDQLQTLYGHREEDTQSYDVEIDLDELLDIESDFKRKEWLGGKVIGAKKSKENVEKFIVELLQRAKTL